MVNIPTKCGIATSSCKDKINARYEIPTFPSEEKITKDEIEIHTKYESLDYKVETPYPKIKKCI